MAFKRNKRGRKRTKRKTGTLRKVKRLGRRPWQRTLGKRAAPGGRRKGRRGPPQRPREVRIWKEGKRQSRSDAAQRSKNAH